MNIDKYIELIKASKRYEDILLNKKQVDLSTLSDLNDYSRVKYKYSCCDNDIEIEPGIYVRNNKIKCFAKFDDFSDIIPYSKTTDINWKHYLYINSYIICVLNRTKEFDENLWFYIYCEIHKKFKYCIDKKNWLEWSVNLAAGCEKIFHEEISDDDWSGTIWKHWRQYRRPPKTNRSWKLSFDKEFYDDDRLVGCKNGQGRHRRLESLTIKEWFKEIFPTCKTRNEVIEKMSEKIGSNFTLSSYKKYKAELFPSVIKEHKEYEKTQVQQQKEKLKERELAFKCFNLMNEYGDKWKSKLTKAESVYGKRHEKNIMEFLEKADDIKTISEYVVNCRNAFGLTWYEKAEISFVNAYYENEEDVEYYIETYLK